MELGAERALAERAVAADRPEAPKTICESVLDKFTELGLKRNDNFAQHLHYMVPLVGRTKLLSAGSWYSQRLVV